MHIVRQGLGIGRRSTATDIDIVGNLHQLVGHAVGDVGAGTGSGIGAHHYASVKWHGQNGGTRADFAGLQIVGVVLFAHDLQVGHVVDYCCCRWIE